MIDTYHIVSAQVTQEEASRDNVRLLLNNNSRFRGPEGECDNEYVMMQSSSFGAFDDVTSWLFGYVKGKQQSLSFTAKTRYGLMSAPFRREAYRPRNLKFYGHDFYEFEQLKHVTIANNTEDVSRIADPSQASVNVSSTYHSRIR